MRTIPLIDLKKPHEELRHELQRAIDGVIASGRFVLGPEVQGFEEELGEVCGGSFAVGVSSGTDALLVSLMALGVGTGDEVVTSAFTFFATAGVIARLGARPVFADIEEGTFNLDPAHAASVVSAATKAIVPVNLYGRLAILPKVSVPIIEDAAQSIGCGAPRGIAACYSFFPTKNVGALGDAGAVVTRDADFANQLRLLRTHGAKPKYFHATVGGNFRIDALQAAVLRVKLGKLTEWNAARRSNAMRYRELFSAADLTGRIRLPEDSPEHVYHQFTIRTERRDELQAFLKEKGIGTEVYYPKPLHLQECFADLGYRPGSLPNTEQAALQALSLPIHPYLSAEDQEYVVDQISVFLRTASIRVG